MLEHTKISSQKLYKKIIAIDLDGTILDSSERHNVVMRKVLDLYNINLDCGGIVDYKKRGKSNIDFLKEHIDSIDPCYTIQAKWIRHIEDKDFLAYDKLYHRASLFLEKLSKSNYLILVTARNDEYNLLEQVRLLEVENFFEKIFVVSPGKNAAKEKYEALNPFKVDYFIGDTEVDSSAAYLLNTRFIAVNYGFRTNSFWEYKGIKSYSSFNEITSLIDG